MPRHLRHLSLATQLDLIDWNFSAHIPKARGIDIHQLHWYPATFPSALVGTLIDIIGSGAKAYLDPFCGSGTGPIEAWFRGKRAIGIDSNSFAVEMCRTKVQLIRHASAAMGQDLASQYSEFRKKANHRFEGLQPERLCQLSGMHPDAAKWFISSTLAEIAVIKNWLSRPSSLVSEWEPVLRMVLSSLLHRHLSVARRYHYTYLVDNSKLGAYALAPVDTSSLYATAIKNSFTVGQITREQQLHISPDFLRTKVPVFIGRNVDEILSVVKSGVDLVVTSPPYFGMNDYTRSQYLSWLVFQWDGYADDILKELGSRRRRTSIEQLDTYTEKMKSAFCDIYDLMNPDGYLAVILGQSNTSLAQESNPTGTLRADIVRTGFHPLWQGNRRVMFRKINNIPYRAEEIWVFKK